MFYFISDTCKINVPIKVHDIFTIRNPSKLEHLKLLEAATIEQNQWNILIDSQTKEDIDNELKHIIIFDIHKLKTPDVWNRKDYLREYTKYKNLIDFYIFIISRLNHVHNITSLTSSLSLSSWTIDSTWFTLFQKLIKDIIVYSWERNPWFTLQESTLNDIFSVHELLDNKRIDRIIYIWGIISLINETSDYKLKFNLLIWILENLLVNKNEGISEQIKVKMISILIQIENYDIKYAVPLKSSYFKQFKNYYHIRSLIVHWEFKAINTEIKKCFWDEYSIMSVTFWLEDKVSKLLYVYLINPSLVNLLKDS